ncbi:MAG: drug/metabolite transporter (DMT)-like permease [Cryomorphaceae bacterium]|jgi:drug/metabolite transporter (DMT)-like permease
MKKAKVGNLLLLHVVVFIFGFTGILGKLIETDSDLLVWWRMLIAAISIALFAYPTGKIQKSIWLNAKTYLGVGFLIALHWVTFFQAIKISNVSVTLACLSSASLFTAILEPLIFKRKIDPTELFFGSMVVVGLVLIFSFETEYATGIIMALTSAFLASLFTVINGRLIQKDNPYRISLVEMIGGVLGISIWLGLSGKIGFNMIDIPASDWFWIIILGSICTGFAFVASVKVMEELTPFTVSLTINLEPVYGIILAFFIFRSSEEMTFGFYVGTVLILGALYLNALKKKGKLPFRKAVVKRETND